MKIKHGDIFDIGQTVNGVSRFIYLSGLWYYFEDMLNSIYEYSQEDLTDVVMNKSGLEDIEYIGNIFESDFKHNKGLYGVSNKTSKNIILKYGRTN